MKRAAILTSGGDAPGMNAAIRAATLVARAEGLEMFGVRRGYEGLMEGKFVPLPSNVVGGLQGRGGTVLGSARSAAFRDKEGRDRARAVLAGSEIEGLLVVGGNGSLTGLQRLLDPEELGEQPLRGIGIPASIDNDIGLTRLALGVDTAVNTIVDACDKLADTAGSHGRAFIVEVMGRDCGYLAMAAGVSAGAHAVLYPEDGKSRSDLTDAVLRAVRKADVRDDSRRHALILKAEGVSMSLEELRNEVEAKIREEKLRMDLRVTVLGHVVRGGRPSALDRQIGNRLGNAAVRGLFEGRSGVMAAWGPASLPPGVGELSNDPRVAYVPLADALEETRKMLSGTSDFVRWRKDVLRTLEDVMSS
jgi:6-phosphofructokinase 1